MKVYKGYLIAIKRNISTIILYCTIFLGVAVSMVYLSGREEAGGRLYPDETCRRGGGQGQQSVVPGSGRLSGEIS